MTAAEGGGIFISYRRHDSSHLAGRLYDRLADRFGEGQVFIDVDAPGPAAEDDGPSGQYPDWCCSVLARAKISAPIGVVTSALVRRRPASL